MPTGTRRKYLYARPESDAWQYKFIIDGKTFRGSTECVEASEAAKVVDIERAAARRRLQAEADAIGHISAGSCHLTLSQCLERFRAAKEGEWRNSKCGRVNAEYCLSIADGPNTIISQISLPHLIAFRAQRKRMLNRKGEPIKDTTINRDIAHLRAAINYAAKSGFATPAIDWTAALKTRAEKHRTRTLSENEETRLFEAIRELHPDLEGPVRFAILSAARKAAVFSLTWNSIDWHEEIAYIDLKGEGDQPISHPLPLTKEMVELLDAQPRVDGCSNVFTYECRRGDKRAGLVKGVRYPWTEHGIYKPWKAVLEKAEIRDFRFHDLRHTGATRLVRGTNNLEVARQLLGHASIKTTQKYANLGTSDVRAAMESIARPRLKAV